MNMYTAMEPGSGWPGLTSLDSGRSVDAVFISGGGSGIGRAVARLFAQRGWFVGLGDICPAGMAETRDLLPAGSCSVHILDVRDPAQWAQALAEFSLAAGGRIALVFNNAGIAFGGPLMELSEAEIDMLIAVNFRGAVNGARAAYPHLRAAGPGSCLLNSASAASIYGAGGISIYSATKFAVRALTEALDAEWLADGIRVCSIMPGFTDTPMLDGPANAASTRQKRDAIAGSGRVLLPVEDVAQAAWDAVHGTRMHTIVGKAVKKMDLAARFAPGYMRKKARGLLAARG
jgi:NAD(P)-dependent dehydrogenase (short-subunit alcohol dehydrogenase family)